MGSFSFLAELSQCILAESKYYSLKKDNMSCDSKLLFK